MTKLSKAAERYMNCRWRDRLQFVCVYDPEEAAIKEAVARAYDAGRRAEQRRKRK